MTITLDGLTLSVQSVPFDEDDQADEIETDMWEDGSYARDLHIYRKAKQWRLRCVEQDVDWANSAAKQLGTAMVNGGANSDGVLSFIVDEGVLHQVGTVDVYLTQLRILYESVRIRWFELDLQQKED